jgi:hypothetical protein
MSQVLAADHQQIKSAGKG